MPGIKHGERQFRLAAGAPANGVNGADGRRPRHCKVARTPGDVLPAVRIAQLLDHMIGYRLGAAEKAQIARMV
jgi:hypothetical protein